MTAADALALYERACASHKRADWRMACHALAAMVRDGKSAKPDPVREAMAGAAVEDPQKRERSLLEFLSLRGLRDDGGDLAALDAQLWHRAAPFRRRLIRDDGMGLDAAALLAWEHGYFPDCGEVAMESSENMHPVGQARFVQAITRELAGRPSYPWQELAPETFEHLAPEPDDYPADWMAEREVA